MKIVFISLFRKGQGGGEGRVAHELARQFTHEHDVILICPDKETGLFRDETGLKTFGVRSITSGEFDMPALSGRTVRQIFDFLDQYEPDIVHSHEPALMGLIGQVWAKMHMVPFVHTSHVLPAKVLNFGAKDALDIKVLQSSLSEAITRRVLMDFYENCDAIIALNQAAVDAFRNFGYTGKIVVIPNGRDLQKYTRRAFADFKTGEKRLSFIGFISERKNQEYLIEVMKHLPDHVKLLLIGKPLDKEYGKELESLVRKYELNVEFLGQIPHSEIPVQLEKSHIFTSASKMEVQSLVIIEALASGTPVVALPNETTEELIDESVGVLLEKGTKPAAYAQAIQEILSLPEEEYLDLSQQARKRVSHLDWSNIVSRTVSAYQDLQEEKPTISEKESDILINMISTLPSGEVRDILEDQIKELDDHPGFLARTINKLALGQKWQALKRVRGSTWLLAGFTILVSVIGYLFNKGKNKENR
jgi:glycosyltransferase involved in cell wall biosynthesis